MSETQLLAEMKSIVDIQSIEELQSMADRYSTAEVKYIEEMKVVADPQGINVAKNRIAISHALQHLHIGIVPKHEGHTLHIPK